MPESKMAVVNSFLAPLQSAASHLHPQFAPTVVVEEDLEELVVEDIPNYRAEGRESAHQNRPRELLLPPRTKSTESLSSLLSSLPDVVIPETLHNPLPLQCLAASALPEAVREEIDSVLHQYSSIMDGSVCQLQPSRETSSPVLTGAELKGGDRDSVSGGVPLVNGAVSGAFSDELISEKAANGSVKTSLTSPLGLGEVGAGSVARVTLKREPAHLDNINDLGVGFRVTGGVGCASCKTLHTVVTAVSADLAHPGLQEGVLIQRWAGKDLDNCTFEEVKAFLQSFMESSCRDFEVTVKKCNGNVMTPRGQAGSSIFDAPWRRLKAISSLSSSSDQLAPYKVEEDTDSSGDPLSERSRTPSAEFLSSSLPNHILSSPSSPSRSPTPEIGFARNEQHHGPVKVSIPRLNSNAKELSVRPRSPLVKDEGRFSRFPNGMIQLSLKYDHEMEDLEMTLHKIQGQSNKEIHDFSDVFVNTYLLPDTRGQGVRSIPVSGSPDLAGEDSHSYLISSAELDRCVLRVLLWDARKSKKPVFRGEVVLGLCDRDIVSLTGQPIWFTVCPLDPNLPAPPQPIHYKHHNNRHKILHRFKQKALHFGTVTASNLKSSISSNSGLTELDAILGGKTGSKSPKHQQKVNTRSSEILDALRSEVDIDLARHTINEAKLAKLHSILNVLRDSEDSGSNDAEVAEKVCTKEEPSRRPEFLSVFDAGRSDTTHTATLPSGIRKRKKRNKLSKAVLRVLQENSADVSSDSSDNQDDGPPSSTLNRQSMAWLQSHRPNPCDDNRPRSDSFQSIPRLRQSLNAGKIDQVSTYKFDDHSPKRQTHSGEIHNLEHQFTSEGRGLVPEHSHMTTHYKVVDTRSQIEEDSPNQLDTKYASPICKHYSVPVEISVHRISVRDVDESPEMDISRTKSFDVSMKRQESQELISFREKMQARQEKPRSRSTGDADQLESNDEVLLVRNPVGNTSPAGSPVVNRKSAAQVPESPGARGVSSLDFSTRRARSFVGSTSEEREEGRDSDDVAETWAMVPRNISLSKSKSLDDLSDAGAKPKSKSWKHLFSRGQSKQLPTQDESKAIVGDAKLELQYNDINPQCPVVMVKLLDILFQSSRQLPTEFVMKCQVVHNSTGVPLLKDRTLVNIRNPQLPAAPLGLMQFQTSTANLSLQISFFSIGRLFSKKEIGHISLDLNILNLTRDSSYCKWLPITKQNNITPP